MNHSTTLPPKVSGPCQSHLKVSVSKIIYKLPLHSHTKQIKSSSIYPFISLTFWGSDSSTLFYPAHINISLDAQKPRNKPTTTKYPIHCSLENFSKYLSDLNQLTFHLSCDHEKSVAKCVIEKHVLLQLTLNGRGKPIHHMFQLKSTRSHGIIIGHVQIIMALEPFTVLKDISNVKHLTSDNALKLDHFSKLKLNGIENAKAIMPLFKQHKNQKCNQETIHSTKDFNSTENKLNSLDSNVEKIPLQEASTENKLNSFDSNVEKIPLQEASTENKLNSFDSNLEKIPLQEATTENKLNSFDSNLENIPLQEATTENKLNSFDSNQINSPLKDLNEDFKQVLATTSIIPTGMGSLYTPTLIKPELASTAINASHSRISEILKRAEILRAAMLSSLEIKTLDHLCLEEEQQNNSHADDIIISALNQKHSDNDTFSLTSFHMEELERFQHIQEDTELEKSKIDSKIKEDSIICLEDGLIDKFKHIYSMTVTVTSMDITSKNEASKAYTYSTEIILPDYEQRPSSTLPPSAKKVKEKQTKQGPFTVSLNTTCTFPLTFPNAESIQKFTQSSLVIKITAQKSLSKNKHQKVWEATSSLSMTHAMNTTTRLPLYISTTRGVRDIGIITVTHHLLDSRLTLPSRPSTIYLHLHLHSLHSLLFPPHPSTNECTTLIHVCLHVNAQRITSPSSYEDSFTYTLLLPFEWMAFLYVEVWGTRTDLCVTETLFLGVVKVVLGVQGSEDTLAYPFREHNIYDVEKGEEKGWMCLGLCVGGLEACIEKMSTLRTIWEKRYVGEKRFEEICYTEAELEKVSCAHVGVQSGDDKLTLPCISEPRQDVKCDGKDDLKQEPLSQEDMQHITHPKQMQYKTAPEDVLHTTTPEDVQHKKTPEDEDLYTKQEVETTFTLTLTLSPPCPHSYICISPFPNTLTPPHSTHECITTPFFTTPSHTVTFSLRLDKKAPFQYKAIGTLYSQKGKVDFECDVSEALEGIHERCVLHEGGVTVYLSLSKERECLGKGGSEMDLFSFSTCEEKVQVVKEESVMNVDNFLKESILDNYFKESADESDSCAFSKNSEYVNEMTFLMQDMLNRVSLDSEFENEDDDVDGFGYGDSSKAGSNFEYVIERILNETSDDHNEDMVSDDDHYILDNDDDYVLADEYLLNNYDNKVKDVDNLVEDDPILNEDHDLIRSENELKDEQDFVDSDTIDHMDNNVKELHNEQALNENDDALDNDVDKFNEESSSEYGEKEMIVEPHAAADINLIEENMKCKSHVEAMIGTLNEDLVGDNYFEKSIHEMNDGLMEDNLPVYDSETALIKKSIEENVNPLSTEIIQVSSEDTKITEMQNHDRDSSVEEIIMISKRPSTLFTKDVSTSPITFSMDHLLIENDAAGHGVEDNVKNIDKGTITAKNERITHTPTLSDEKDIQILSERDPSPGIVETILASSNGVENTRFSPSKSLYSPVRNIGSSLPLNERVRRSERRSFSPLRQEEIAHSYQINPTYGLEEDQNIDNAQETKIYHKEKNKYDSMRRDYNPARIDEADSSVSKRNNRPGRNNDTYDTLPRRPLTFDSHRNYHPRYDFENTAPRRPVTSYSPTRRYQSRDDTNDFTERLFTPRHNFTRSLRAHLPNSTQSDIFYSSCSSTYTLPPKLTDYKPSPAFQSWYTTLFNILMQGMRDGNLSKRNNKIIS